jgi:ribonuclease HI
MSDSQLLIRQLQGIYSVRSPRIYPLWKRMTEETHGLDISFRWIPREENKSADALSRKAYEEEYLRERKKSAESCLILKELGKGIFLVRGRHGTYEVDLEKGTCGCFDWKIHREKGFDLPCKHIIAAGRRKEEEESNLRFGF